MTPDFRSLVFPSLALDGIGNLLGTCRADWQANPGNTKIRLALLFFRISNWSLSLNPASRALSAPVRAIYKIIVGWLLGIDIPPETSIGPGLRIMHGTGLVVHAKAEIGRGCTLRHGVTLGITGARARLDGPPLLGDFVDVGSGAQILGPVRIGRGTVIGAGSVVLRDVPAGATAVGNPARILPRSDNN